MESSQTPPKPTQHLMLLLLAEEPTYGVELLRRLEARSGGRISLNAGSLYRLIARLVDEGLIEAAPTGVDTAEPGAPRKVYRVTSAGTELLRAEARRQASLVEMARGLDLIEEA